MIDWTNEVSLPTAKHQQLHSLHPGAQIQGQMAGLLQQTEITTERFYSANLSEYPHSCNKSMLLDPFRDI